MRRFHLLLIGLFVFAGCNEDLAVDEKWLLRDKEIAAFVRMGSNAHGTHNIDTDLVEFSYKVPPGYTLNEADSIAEAHGWQIIKNSISESVYKKGLLDSSVDNQIDATMYVRFDNSEGRIRFKTQ